MKKLAADPAIHANSASDLMHVTTDSLAQIRDFINERNFRGQKSVRRIFDQLSALK